MMQDEHAYICSELGKAEEYIKELEEKLRIATDALEFYSKQTGCECSPSYVPARAIEALEKINGKR